MKTTTKFFTALLILVSFTPALRAEPTLPPAQDFSLTGSDGKTHTLSEAKGKFVVLEWTNHQCPFVNKFYSSGEMQKLQKKFTAKGVVWYSIVSSAPGKEGYVTADDVVKIREQQKTASTATLLDPDGKVGRLYNAKTTPDMFVINPEGKIIYFGAIDSIPSVNSADIPKAVNYVEQTLNSALAGHSPSVGSTKSYGCSVKY